MDVACLGERGALARLCSSLDPCRLALSLSLARKMFAGLNVDGDSSDDSSDDEKEPTLPPVAPAPSRPATLLPEADDEASMPPSPEPAARAVGGSADLLGGIDPDDLEITISTLKAVASDMTLLRSLPFKALRQALGPLAEELLGASNQRGRGGARNSKQGGTRIGGLSPEERLKQERHCISPYISLYLCISPYISPEERLKQELAAEYPG